LRPSYYSSMKFFLEISARPFKLLVMLYDLVILGHGPTGSILSETAIEWGLNVLVLDTDIPLSAWPASTAVYSPISGPKNAISWKAAEAFPRMLTFYSLLEQQFSTEIMHKLPVFKMEQDSQVFCNKLHKTLSWSCACSSDISSPLITSGPVKGFDLGPGGYVDFYRMIRLGRHKLGKRFKNTMVSDRDIHFGRETIKIGAGISAKYLIDARGMQSFKSRLWDWLPIRPVFGTSLIIEFLKDPGSCIRKRIISAGFTLYHVKDNLYILGSDYSRTLNQHVSREELLSRLAGFFETENIHELVKVHKTRTGLRAGTHDRKPYTFLHPKHPSLVLFNGLGSKSVYLLPWLSEMLLARLFQNKPLPEEADIDRVLKYIEKQR
jgi:glycine oxidase